MYCRSHRSWQLQLLTMKEQRCMTNECRDPSVVHDWHGSDWHGNIQTQTRSSQNWCQASMQMQATAVAHDWHGSADDEQKQTSQKHKEGPVSQTCFMVGTNLAARARQPGSRPCCISVSTSSSWYTVLANSRPTTSSTYATISTPSVKIIDPCACASVKPCLTACLRL